MRSAVPIISGLVCSGALAASVMRSVPEAVTQLAATGTFLGATVLTIIPLFAFERAHTPRPLMEIAARMAATMGELSRELHRPTADVDPVHRPDRQLRYPAGAFDAARRQDIPAVGEQSSRSARIYAGAARDVRDLADAMLLHDEAARLNALTELRRMADVLATGSIGGLAEPGEAVTENAKDGRPRRWARP
ncbi:hypothetical protein Afil01_12310 [Actinorhabdospora filicis]|uniref:Uncharacterized protein n=1 Tax=Actinorhabdospora filicis TaxID=1785913 RepID=A0A9W6SFX5_9ACTN|nr:hypothetical protein [Actinorhabdospora filicis]GLZ76424.1 hypothetical protein Afil01_12310 [Actinorhabdospora filicis]